MFHGVLVTVTLNSFSHVKWLKIHKIWRRLWFCCPIYLIEEELDKRETTEIQKKSHFWFSCESCKILRSLCTICEFRPLTSVARWEPSRDALSHSLYLLVPDWCWWVRQARGGGIGDWSAVNVCQGSLDIHNCFSRIQPGKSIIREVPRQAPTAHTYHTD